MAIVDRSRRARLIDDGLPLDGPLATPQIARALDAVGRVELEGNPYFKWAGTGFFVSPFRFLTARNVAEVFCEGSGDVGLALKADAKAFFVSAAGVAAKFRLPVTGVRFIHPYFDVALCELGASEMRDGSEDAQAWLTLSADASLAVAGRKAAVVAFAAADSRNDPAAVNEVFGDIREGRLYYLEGLLRGQDNERGVPSLGHDCPTLGGSGGAPLIDLGTGLVLGVHHAGVYMTANYAVPAMELGRDARVRSHGVPFSDDPPWMRTWVEREAAARRAREEGAQVPPAIPGATTPPPVSTSPPPSQPPEVDVEVRHFSQPNLYKLKDLLTDAGFATDASFYKLFVSMTPRYVSMLPTDGSPADRLLGALNAINHTAELTTGELPFRTLLFNAVENSKPLPVSNRLKVFLDQLPLV